MLESESCESHVLVVVWRGAAMRWPAKMLVAGDVTTPKKRLRPTETALQTSSKSQQHQRYRP